MESMVLYSRDWETFMGVWKAFKFQCVFFFIYPVYNGFDREWAIFRLAPGWDFLRIRVAILRKCSTRKKIYTYIYGIWYFKKTTHCSERVVSSLRQEITRKSHCSGGKTLTQRVQKIKQTKETTNKDKSWTLVNKTVAWRKPLWKFGRKKYFLFC